MARPPAAVVLAGGRSARMGTAKAGLEWHGSTLLRRVVGLVGRATGGPVVVVAQRGQPLPALPAGVEVVHDAAEGLGPLQGIATGLAAVAGRADAAYVSATDVPLLHPAFVRRVVAALDDAHDVVLPAARGFEQPLAAVYRTTLAGRIDELIAAGHLRPAGLFARCRVLRLADAALLADPALAEVDPALDSVVNLNTVGEYEAARARAAPAVRVSWDGASRVVVAATLGAAATAVGLAGREDGTAVASGPAGGGPIAATVDGDTVTGDPTEPLAAGELIVFRSATPGTHSA